MFENGAAPRGETGFIGKGRSRASQCSHARQSWGFRWHNVYQKRLISRHIWSSGIFASLRHGRPRRSSRQVASALAPTPKSVSRWKQTRFSRLWINSGEKLCAGCVKRHRLCTENCVYPRLSALRPFTPWRKLGMHAKALIRRSSGRQAAGQPSGDPVRVTSATPGADVTVSAATDARRSLLRLRSASVGRSIAGQRRRLSLPCGSWGRGPFPSGNGSRLAPATRERPATAGPAYRVAGRANGGGQPKPGRGCKRCRQRHLRQTRSIRKVVE